MPVLSIEICTEVKALMFSLGGEEIVEVRGQGRKRRTWVCTRQKVHIDTTRAKLIWVVQATV